MECLKGGGMRMECLKGGGMRMECLKGGRMWMECLKGRGGGDEDGLMYCWLSHRMGIASWPSCLPEP